LQLLYLLFLYFSCFSVAFIALFPFNSLIIIFFNSIAHSLLHSFPWVGNTLLLFFIWKNSNEQTYFTINCANWSISNNIHPYKIIYFHYSLCCMLPTHWRIIINQFMIWVFSIQSFLIYFDELGLLCSLLVDLFKSPIKNTFSLSKHELGFISYPFSAFSQSIS